MGTPIPILMLILILTPILILMLMLMGTLRGRRGEKWGERKLTR